MAVTVAHQGMNLLCDELACRLLLEMPERLAGALMMGRDHQVGVLGKNGAGEDRVPASTGCRGEAAADRSRLDAGEGDGWVSERRLGARLSAFRSSLGRAMLWSPP